MSGLSALLSINTATLDAQVEIAGNSGGASVSISITDPLDLLGETGELIRSVQEIAAGGGDIGATLGQAFEAIGEIAPFADIPAIGEFLATIEALKARLQPLEDLMGLDPAALVGNALEGFGGAEAIVERVAGQIVDTVAAEVPEAIAIPMRALRDLADGSPGSADDVAAFFARFVLGLDLGALRAPFEMLEAARTQLAGGEAVAALEARIVALTLEIDLAAEALVGRSPDMPAILARLAQARAQVDLLTGTVLPRAIDGLTGDIAAIDVGTLAGQLDGVLAPLVDRVPVPPRGLGDFFLPPLRMLGDGIDTLTADMLTEVLAEVEANIRAMFAASDVARLRDDARTLLAGVVAFLNDLPLPALREQLSQALLEIEGRIASLGDFSPVAEIGDRMREVADAIEGIDTSAVTGRIAALADEVRALAERFPIEEIKAELGGLIGQAEAAVDDLPPLIADLRAKIDTLAEEITSIDLSAAGDVSVGAVQDLREQVNTALSGADLPDALSVPIGILAGAVREIDLSASIDAPLTDLVARIDISGVLAPVQAAIDAAREALQKLSPTALVARLDEPFDAAMAQLETVSPTALVGQLSAGFNAAIGEIDRLDPVTLVQPLQAEFDRLLGTLREAADPAPLISPLRAAYAELQALLDLIDPTQLLGRVIGEVSRLPGAMGSATGEMLASRLDPAGVLPPSQGGGAIRFGDMVRPFAALVNEARAVVTDAADDLLEEGLALVSQPLEMLSHAGRVAGGHVAQLADAIEARRALVDPTSPTGPMADLRSALDRLARIEAALEASGRSSVELNAGVASVQLDAYVTVSFPARQDLDRATQGLSAGLNTGSIARSMHGLGQVLGSFAPSALALPNTQASIRGRIDALFDTIDPTPIADEMDAIGMKIEAKLQSFAAEIAKSLFNIWNGIFEEMEPVLPKGILSVIGDVMDAIRGQLSALDPASLEAELDELLDAVMESLQAYSPTAFAGTLMESFEALKAKLRELDPATLIGDLGPLEEAFDEIKSLKPSIVLRPLTEVAENVDAALADLLDFDPAAIVAAAIVNLKEQIEIVLQRIEVELDGLLGDLEGGGGGSVSVSASASIG